MSSDTDERRFAVRRASLRAALSNDDVRAAARAASRLRINGQPLTLEEFTSARAVRRTLGLALVKARLPKPDPMPPRGPTVAIPPARRSRRRLAAVAASALLVLIAVLVFGGGAEPPGGGTPARAAEPQRDRIVVQSRGRTVSLPQEVVVEESPTPTPSAEPTAEPTAPVAVAAPTSPTTGTPGPSAGAGGSGGGNGGGSGTGSGSGRGSGSASPAPSPTPRVPPPGFSRLNVIVYDAQNRRPLEGVCIVIGTPNCGPNAPHTASDGRWSADVAASSNATKWQLIYTKTGYATVLQEITLPGGVSRTYIIYLRRRG